MLNNIKMYKSCKYCHIQSPAYLYWLFRKQLGQSKYISIKLITMTGTGCYKYEQGKIKHAQRPCFIDPISGKCDKQDLDMYVIYNRLINNIETSICNINLSLARNIENPMHRIFCYETMHLIEYLMKSIKHKPNTSKKRYYESTFTRLYNIVENTDLDGFIHLSSDYLAPILDAANRFNLIYKHMSGIPYYPDPDIYRPYKTLLIGYYTKKCDLAMIDWVFDFTK